jgi:hypothetical protein
MKLLKESILLVAIGLAVLGFGISAKAASINPTTRNFTKDGGGGAVIVTAGAAENWTATTDSAWINVTPTTSGTGNGTVAYLVSANLSADNRSGEVTIGGQIHTVNQSGYTSVINPLSASYNLTGGYGVINVTVDAGISWSAVSDSAWCSITAGSSGFGSGSASFDVSANPGVATRYANITVAGQVFTVTQTGTDVVLSPSTATVGPETSLIQFDINALSTTSWTVVPQVDWVYPLGTSSGSGAASITLAVVPNSSWQQRVGTVQVGSALLTIAQSGVANPVYSLTPPSVTAASPGAAGAIAVSATMDAPWTVASQVPWVTVVSGASGTGNGGVQYVVSQNPYTTDRTGTVVLTGSAPQTAPNLIRAELSHVGYIYGSPGLGPNAGSFRPNNPDGQETYYNNTSTSYIDYLGMWARTQTNCTYAFWFRTDYANRINRLFSLENGGTWANVYTEADGRLRSDGPNGSLYPSSWIQANQWYHLILRQTSTNVDMWLNGKKIASAAWANQFQLANNRVRFGGGGPNWGAANFYQGSIDEYRCWDRDLSDQEVSLLYTTELAGTSTQPYNVNVATPTLPRTDGRLARYLFDKNTVDADQFGRNWVPQNSPGWTADHFGRPNSAVSCTSGSACVQVPREDQFHTNNAATHIFWVKFNDLSARNVFEKEWRDASASEGMCCPWSYYNLKDRFFLRIKDGNNLTLVWRRERIGRDVRDIASYNVEKALSTSQWYQFCVTGNGSNGNVSLYINGVLYSTVSMPGFGWGKLIGTDASFGAAYLGVNNEVGGANAAYDDYQIYDRELSATEVASKYNSEGLAVLTHTVTQAGAVGQLSAASTNFPAAGGSGSVNLSIGSAAVWSASSDSAWLTLVSTNSGFGSATINYSVSPNSSINNRIGTLTIAGISYIVTQSGRGVTVTGGTSFGFGPDGGSGSFNISSENNASWAVNNTNSWITIASGGSGTAPGTCIFVVSPYGSPLVARTGFMYVGSNVIAVTQSGYTASVSPLVNIATPNGGSQSVTVSVPSGAIWSAIAQVPWITIVGGQSQSGSGNLTYIISGNAGGTRSGTIVVAGQVVTVTQNSANPGSVVNLYTGSTAGRPGDQVLVPISGVNFSNIQTAQFTVKWDYTQLGYVGVEQYGLPGITTANFGFPTAGAMTFSWEHPTLDASSLAPNAPLFAIRFNVLGTPGTSTQVRLDSQPTLIELTDVNANPNVVVTTNGSVSILNTFDISGNVKYQGSQYYVSNVVITASGDLNATINSGMSNSYELSVSNGAYVTISASKTTDTSPTAGISTADIVLIRRHVLGLAPITDPYKLLAADANGSTTISTADISALRKLILGTTNALPGPMWIVVPTDYIFQNPLLPWNPPNYRQYNGVAGPYTGQHFAAIKVGDVDGSWTNSAGASVTPNGVQLVPRDLDPSPLLTVSSGTANPTGSVSLDIVVSNFTGITGLQFSMDWDPSLLSYAGVTSGGLPLFGPGNIGLAYTNAGKLGIAWDDIYGTGVTLPDGTNLFTISFVAKGLSGTSGVNISDVPTMREVVFGTTSRTPTSVDGHVLIASVVESPILIGQSMSNEVFNIVFGYTPGVSYGIDYSTNLTSWLPVPNPQIIINGGTAYWSDDGSLTGGIGEKKFYRVNAN